jgi:hypothetical protein
LSVNDPAWYPFCLTSGNPTRMNLKRCLMTFLVLVSLTAFAQVSDIKSSSKSNSSSRSSGGGSDRGGSGGNVFFFLDLFRVFGAWQGHVLDKRPDVPQVVSLDLMMQSAIQPSQYYTFNPRVRGNWGILSTDFRWNVLIEETIDGPESLNTFDWQIAQLNFVNTRNVIVRAGAGFMQENFADRLSFFESSISSNLMFDEGWGGFVEWRSAKDFVSQAVPRREFNLQVQKQIFESGPWHGMVTGGLQFQRWYSTTNVWGIQGGFVLKLY